MLLEAARHEVFTVSDGRAAVAAAGKLKPDLILMDLSLPFLTGWEAARQIRSEPATRSIPILAVTAHAMQGDRERALAAGCDGFIPKPINEETFAARVASYLGTRSGASSSLARHAELPGGGPARILVVDDQIDVARLIQEDLQADGHEVVIAMSAAEGRVIFQKDGRFDLCVIDVMLGGETGYALTQSLAPQTPDFVPVLLLTAGTIDREKGFAVGADDFIGKPIDTVELRARARSLIRVGRLVREQRRLGRERSEAYRKLSELDRMRSDFLSTVSHELRTPLNTIVLLAHQLEKNPSPKDGERRERDVRILLEAAEALRRMIDNMLDLAKLEAGQRDLHPQSVSIRELLRENVDIVEPLAREKGLALTIEAHPDLPATSSFDGEKLSRVLVNLLSNAVKYTTTGRITVSATPWQGSTAFEVRDTGRGIPPELIGAAFEPFRQIRPRTGDSPRGTGLGLTISKQLVAVMGGDLFLESKEGEGTRVRFTLPDLPLAPSDDGPKTSEISTAMPQEMRRQALVLIIEDDQASRYGLGSLLESEGYRVEEAADLQQANTQLQKVSPAAIVLDITLPDGDGAVWLRDRLDREGSGAFPPVIALTGVTADADTRRIESAGVWKVLTKPVNVVRLLAVLREALSEAGLK